MTKKFYIKLARGHQEVFEQFKTSAAKNGVDVNGDHRLGHFSGRGIEGRYNFTDDVLDITIVKKPMLIGWSLIEAKVREFFA